MFGVAEFLHAYLAERGCHRSVIDAKAWFIGDNDRYSESVFKHQYVTSLRKSFPAGGNKLSFCYVKYMFQFNYCLILE